MNHEPRHQGCTVRRGAFIIPILLLLILYSFAGRYCVGRSLAGWQPYLKAFEAKAERSKSWLRDRAIEKLALYSGGGVDDEASGAAAKEWASRSAQNGVGNSTVVDVIAIGTANTFERTPTRQKTWAWSDQSARNVFIATEVTTDSAIFSSPNGSCQALMKSCGDASRSNRRRGLASSTTTVVKVVSPDAVSPRLDSGQCLDRRLGLAMGASVGRYRKIINALVAFGRDGGADGILKQYTSQTLPDYLIITYEFAYYNIQRLVGCMGHGGADAPVVYAPFVAWTDVNLSDGTRKKKQSQTPSKTTTSFAYPTRKTGVVFNKAAIEIWIRRFTCFEPVDSPTPIHYDAETHARERDLCGMMTTTMTNGNANATRRNDAFDSAIREIVEISLSAQEGGRTTRRSEFHLSSRRQAVSIGDLLSLYASTLHALCKGGGGAVTGRIPSVEKMFGYLIHRFRLVVSYGDTFGGGAIDSSCANISSAMSIAP